MRSGSAGGFCVVASRRGIRRPLGPAPGCPNGGSRSIQRALRFLQDGTDRTRAVEIAAPLGRQLVAEWPSGRAELISRRSVGSPIVLNGARARDRRCPFVAFGQCRRDGRLQPDPEVLASATDQPRSADEGVSGIDLRDRRVSTHERRVELSAANTGSSATRPASPPAC
jgi:hypothetical protein